MAKNDFGSNKPTMFLGIDAKSGLLFHRVREKDIEEVEIKRLLNEGYKRVVNTNPQTKEDVPVYLRFWPSVTGYVTGFKLDPENQFGERVSLTIEDEEERNVISFNLNNQSGSMVGYAVDLARHVDNIPVSEQIIFGANRNLKNDKGYLVSILNLRYFERVNDKGPLLIERALKKDDIPALKERQMGGKKTYDSYDRDVFLYGYLQKFAEVVEKGKHHFGSSNSSHDTYVPESDAAPTTQQQPSPSVKSDPKPVFDDPVDDLPF